MFQVLYPQEMVSFTFFVACIFPQPPCSTSTSVSDFPHCLERLGNPQRTGRNILNSAVSYACRWIKADSNCIEKKAREQMLLHFGESLAQNVMSLVASLHSSSLDINTVYLFIYFMVYATFSFTEPIIANTQNSLRRIDCQMCRKSVCVK